MRQRVTLLLTIFMALGLLAAPLPEAKAQSSPASEYLPYGVPVPPGQEISGSPEPYQPARHGRPLPNTQPGANAVGKPGVSLPVRPERARGPRDQVPQGAPGSQVPQSEPGSGDRGFWLRGSSTGIHAVNDAQPNLAIPANAIGTTLYTPTHLAAGGTCIETVTAHWYYPGMTSTAHGHGFWDWCASDGSGGWQVFEFMDQSWQQQYVRKIRGEERYSTAVYKVSDSCWIGILYNFGQGLWEEKTTICGISQLLPFFGTVGWTMWESHYLMDQAQVCPVFPNIQASELRAWQNNTWTRLTAATADPTLGPYGLCWINGTYTFAVLPTLDHWQANTPRRGGGPQR
jgi:hypothetical protein